MNITLFETITDIYSLSKIVKELSSLGISSQATNFFSLSVFQSYHAKYLKQQLYVAILTTKDTLKEMENVMQRIHMSEPSWLVIFEQWKGDNLLNHSCLNPKGNLFNLEFNSRMVIKCYNNAILREWYSLHKNDTQVLYLATLNNTDGFKLLVEDTFLYSRRNDVGGVSLRLKLFKVCILDFLNHNIVNYQFSKNYKYLKKIFTYIFELLEICKL